VPKPCYIQQTTKEKEETTSKLQFIWLSLMRVRRKATLVYLPGIRYVVLVTLTVKL